MTHFGHNASQKGRTPPGKTMGRQNLNQRHNWGLGLAENKKNHRCVCRHMFFNVILNNIHSLQYLFNDLSTPSFANLDICNIKFLQCKPRLLDIDIFKYYNFGYADASLSF